MTPVGFDLLEFAANIYSRLVNSAAVQSLVSDRVYNYVPENEQFNYIRHGEPTFAPADDKCTLHYDVTMQIDCFGSTEDKGELEVYKMVKAVHETLNRQPANTDNLEVINLWFTNIVFIRDSNGRSSQGSMTLSALISQK